MSKLTFDTLRAANTTRLPQFKNRHGVPAHSKPDGSDWSPAQWLQALIGELGEFARERIDFERGLISRDEYRERAAKELADVQCYLDILARRALDELEFDDADQAPSQVLMGVVAHLGEYANARKKLERRDFSFEQYAEVKIPAIEQAELAIGQLAEADSDICCTDHPGDLVAKADPAGVNLGIATVRKFNEVSQRVGAQTHIISYVSGECAAVQIAARLSAENDLNSLDEPVLRGDKL